MLQNRLFRSIAGSFYSEEGDLDSRTRRSFFTVADLAEASSRIVPEEEHFVVDSHRSY